MRITFPALAFSAVSLVALGSLVPVAAIAAAPAGSCLGGCLPTANAAPTPVLPANYECAVNWPLATGHASCVVGEDGDFLGAARHHGNPYSVHGGPVHQDRFD